MTRKCKTQHRKVEICQRVFLDMLVVDMYNNNTIDCRRSEKGGNYG